MPSHFFMVTQSSLSVCAFIIVSLFVDRFLYKLLYFSYVCLSCEGGMQIISSPAIFRNSKSNRMF